MSLTPRDVIKLACGRILMFANTQFLGKGRGGIMNNDDECAGCFNLRYELRASEREAEVYRDKIASLEWRIHELESELSDLQEHFSSESKMHVPS